MRLGDVLRFLECVHPLTSCGFRLFGPSRDNLDSCLTPSLLQTLSHEISDLGNRPALKLPPNKTTFHRLVRRTTRHQAAPTSDRRQATGSQRTRLSPAARLRNPSSAADDTDSRLTASGPAAPGPSPEPTMASRTSLFPWWRQKRSSPPPFHHHPPTTLPPPSSHHPPPNHSPTTLHPLSTSHPLELPRDYA